MDACLVLYFFSEAIFYCNIPACMATQHTTKCPLVDVLTTTPNRRARSAVCLTVRGSDGSPADKGRGDSLSNRVRHHIFKNDGSKVL